MGLLRFSPKRQQSSGDTFPGTRPTTGFGAGQNKGIKLDGFKPVIVDLTEGASKDDLWIHDEKDFYKAQILVRMFDDPHMQGHLPRPFGVFYETERACYEDLMSMQIEEVTAQRGKGRPRQTPAR